MQRRAPTLRDLLEEAAHPLTPEEFLVKQMVNYGVGQGLMAALKKRGVTGDQNDVFELLSPEVHEKILELALLAADQLDALAARSREKSQSPEIHG